MYVFATFQDSDPPAGVFCLQEDVVDPLKIHNQNLPFLAFISWRLTLQLFSFYLIGARWGPPPVPF